MVRIEPIKNNNINSVVTLLKDRNDTIAEYTIWKYSKEDDNIDRGYLAYYNDECVGCFGLVPKQIDINGKTETCGWFADWFVLKEYRKYGIGEKLLQALNTNYNIVFGHPGPAKAQQLCSSNGYTPIPYQIRLRYLLNKWSYVKGKTGILPKQLLYLLRVNKEEKRNKTTSSLAPSIYFSENDAYADWIKAQPAAEYFNATFKTYTTNNTSILYLLYNESNKTRGKIVDYKNITTSALAEFLNQIKNEGVEWIDVFTTEPEEAKALSKYPCIELPEAPIMVYGLDTSKGINIKGIDRENWTNLSY